MNLKQNYKRNKQIDYSNQCMICRIKTIKRINQLMNIEIDNKNIKTLKRISQPSLIQIDHKIIKQRHLYPVQRTNYINIIKNITNLKIFHPAKIIFHYVQNLTKEEESMKKYHNFQSTVNNIRSIITKRVQKDFNQPVHFSGFAHQSMLRRMMKKRVINQIKIHNKGKQNGSGTGSSTIQQRKIKKIIDKQVLQKDSQMLQIQKLTKNLQFMVKRIIQHEQFHPSTIFDIQNEGHTFDITKSYYRQILKRQFQDNISIIECKIQNLKTNPQLSSSRKCIQNYGISQIELKPNFKKNQQRKNTGGKPNNKYWQQKYPSTRYQTDYEVQQIKIKNKKNSISTKRLNQKSPRNIVLMSNKKSSIIKTNSTNKLKNTKIC